MAVIEHFIHIAASSKGYIFYYIIFFLYSTINELLILMIQGAKTRIATSLLLNMHKHELFHVSSVHRTTGMAALRERVSWLRTLSQVDSCNYFIIGYAESKLAVFAVNILLLSLGVMQLLAYYGESAIFSNGLPSTIVISYSGAMVWFLLVSLIMALLVINFEQFKYIQIKELLIVWLLVVGLLLTLWSHDFLTLVICLEIVSFCLYICAGLLFVDKKLHLTYLSSVYYFKYGLFATSLLILGVSFLYSQLGVWSIYDICEAMQFEFCQQVNFKLITGANTGLRLAAAPTWELDMAMVFLGIILVSLNFLFKLSVYPLHYWILKVYRNVLFSVFCLFVIVTKLFFLFILVLKFLPFMQLFVAAKALMTVSGVLSLTIGSLGAVFQNEIRLFVAYSSIASIGVVFITIGLDYEKVVCVAVFYYIIYSVALYVILINIFPTAVGRGLLIQESFVTIRKIFQVHPFIFNFVRLLLFMIMGIPLFIFFINKLYLYFALFVTRHLVLFIYLFIIFTLMAAYYLRMMRLSNPLANSAGSDQTVHSKWLGVKRYGVLLVVLNYCAVGITAMNPLSPLLGLDTCQLLLIISS